MDKLKIDAVITDLELQLETSNNPYGSFVNFSDTFDVYTIETSFAPLTFSEKSSKSKVLSSFKPIT